MPADFEKTSNLPLRVVSIDHVVLRCVNFERTLAFYRDILGCPVERTVERVGLYQLRAGSALIDLVPVGSQLGGEGEPRPEHHNLAHFCLGIEVPDWQSLLDYLEQHGIQSEPPEQRYGAGGTGPSIYIRDPEGNTVELKTPAFQAGD